MTKKLVHKPTGQRAYEYNWHMAAPTATQQEPVLQGIQAYEDKLRKVAQRYTGMKHEDKLVERKFARAHRQIRKDLQALCTQYSGHRELHVRVKLVTGTIYTDVQLTADPECYVGRRYPNRVLEGELCGEWGQFRLSKVVRVYLARKTEAIVRR